MYTSLLGTAISGGNASPTPVPRVGAPELGNPTAATPSEPWQPPMTMMSQYDRLPAPLKMSGYFCVWRYERRENSDKLAKVPYNPVTKTRANAADPSTFVSFDQAVGALSTGYYNGIGVGIFSNLVALDIDHCIDSNGRLSPLAADVGKIMNAYAERSPSCRGIRILCTVPIGFQFDKTRYYINNHSLGLEIYVAGSTAKYTTVTGQVIYDMGLEERGQELLAVLEKYMVRSNPIAPVAAPDVPPAPLGAPLTEDDHRLLRDIWDSPCGGAFRLLMSGDLSAYGNDPSRGDLAFCNFLAARTDNFWKIDRIFRSTPLYRPKWDSPRGAGTYLCALKIVKRNKHDFIRLNVVELTEVFRTDIAFIAVNANCGNQVRLFSNHIG